jgi:cation transporter-like permease
MQKDVIVFFVVLYVWLNLSNANSNRVSDACRLQLVAMTTLTLTWMMTGEVLQREPADIEVNVLFLRIGELGCGSRRVQRAF